MGSKLCDAVSKAQIEQLYAEKFPVLNQLPKKKSLFAPR